MMIKKTSSSQRSNTVYSSLGLLACLQLLQVSSFSQTSAQSAFMKKLPTAASRQQRQPSSLSFVGGDNHRQVGLFATVYGPDGGKEEDYGNASYLTATDSSDSFFSDDENDTSSSSTGPIDISIIDTLSRDHMDTLARLAVAHSGKEHGFSVKDLEMVHVLDIDHMHVLLSAVLCDNRGCVTIAVPVAFPSPCSIDEGDKLNGNLSGCSSCILDNIMELDSQAKLLLDYLEFEESNKEESGQQQQIQVELCSELEIEEYPEWWVYPGTVSMFFQDDCDSIKSLLNDNDFSSEINSVAINLIDTMQKEDQFIDGDVLLEVQNAGVAAVGPSGLLLRVQVKQIPPSDGDIETIKIYDVPVKFETEASNVEELRTNVLMVVDSVENA